MKTVVTTPTTTKMSAAAVAALFAVLAVLPSEGRRIKRKSKTHIHSPIPSCDRSNARARFPSPSSFPPLSAASCVNPHLSLSIGKCPRE